ncbi:MAG TPA: VOC family protein [Bryobacteraceae bacterium]|nr:VOC family protein [Bryobacteraceae bacterium]
MPKPTPIPPGFHSLTLHLMVKGAADYIDFLKRAFNAVELGRSPGPGGKLMHATVQVGDSLMMLADDFCAEFGQPPFAVGRMPFVVHLYVPDADAAWSQAVAAGCEVTVPISDQFWGDRYGTVKDPFGVNWAIATRQEEVTPEEAQARADKMFGGAHA